MLKGLSELISCWEKNGTGLFFTEVFEGLLVLAHRTAKDSVRRWIELIMNM